jgi:RNA polymerase-binding transcription factor
MTDDEIQEYKTKLLKKKEEILSEMQKLHSNTSSEKDEGQEDLADRAAQAYQSEYLSYLNDTEQLILQLIEEALERVDSGTYGFCIACSGKIQKKRLDAVPWARHCIHCQELQEQGAL